MAIAILVPIIAFSAMALKMLQDAERAAALQGLHETARSISLLVDKELYSSEAALKVLASSHHLAIGDMDAFHNQAKTASRGPDAWTLLMDESGQQVMNTIALAGTKPAAPMQAPIRQVLETQKTVVSDVIAGSFVKTLITTLNVPAITPDGKQFVLATAFSTGHFNKLMVDAAIDPGWLVAIIDSNGRFIARSINKEALVGKPARPELVAAAKLSKDGYIRHKTLEDVEVYDVFTHSSLAGWTVAVAAPVEIIERSAREANLVAALGMLAAILFAAGAARLFGGHFVSSIERATKSAIQLGRGTFPESAKSRVAEVNELHVALGEAGNLLAQAKLDRNAAEAERQSLLMSEKAAREAAQAQNAAKDQFLAMLGHELRNPLAPISIAAELLKLPGIDEKRLHNTSNIISRQVEHMNSLVNDLLDVSRVTRGLVNLHTEPVDISAIVRDAIEQVQPIIDARQHKLSIQLPSEPAWLNGDKTRLIQVVVNLLNNAAKYTPPSGQLAIHVTADSDWIELTVKDNGMGVEPDLLPRIFELFAQGKRAPDRAQGGLGLGLALVKSLVEHHGGNIAVQSDGEGKGSTFIVRLPRSYVQALPVTSGTNPTSLSSNPARVMIVDDNVDAAQSLAHFLTEAGKHKASAYFNAKSALEQVRMERPDVIVLDIGLPDMDGYELARQIRRLPDAGKIILIALTGYGMEQDREQAQAAGFNYHLSKPANPARILELVSQCTT